MSFFPKLDIDITKVKGNPELLKPPKTKEYTCEDCGSCSLGSSSSPAPSKIWGEGKKGILVVADALDKTVALSGDIIPKLYRELLEKATGGKNLYEDIYIVNAIRGVPQGNIGTCGKACNKQLLKTIKELQPKVIVTLGFRALHTLWNQHDISVTDKWEQWVAIDKDIAIPDQILGCFVVPMFDPKDFIWSLQNKLVSVKKWAEKSKLEKNYVSKYHQAIISSRDSIVNIDGLWDDELLLRFRWFKRDWETVYNYSEKEFPIQDNVLELYTNENVTEALEAIEYFKTQPMIVTDIETTSLSPYRDLAEILCIGFSNLKRNVGITTKNPKVISAVKELLSMKKKWLIHNIGFEYRFFKYKWGVDLKGDLIDTQVLVHCFDPRAGCSGLKPSTVRYVGVSGYEKNSSKFFAVREEDKNTRFHKGALEINMLGEALERHKVVEAGLLYPIDPNQHPEIPAKEIKAENRRRNKEYKKGSLSEKELLSYVAQDCVYTGKVFIEISKRLMDTAEWEAVQFYSKGSVALAKMSLNGIKISQKAVENGLKEVDREIHSLHKQILETEEAKQWDGVEEFNYNSGQQLGHLLFDILGYKGGKKTKTGWATDKNTIGLLKSPMCDLITKKKEMTKTKSTYLLNILREVDNNGFAHPTFSLSLVSSFRSSAHNFNIQNQVKHNPRMMKLVRSCISAPKGFTLSEIDYTGCESMAGSLITGDPIFYAFNVGGKDIHKEVAKKVFGIPGEDLLILNTNGKELIAPDGLFKRLRQISKKFTFSVSYGASAKSVARTMWDEIGALSEQDKLYIQGLFNLKSVSNFDSFESVVKEAYEWFWGDEMFGVYHKWTVSVFKEYMEKGYIRNATGFCYRQLMSSLNVGNYVIQSVAFQKLLVSIMLLQDKIEELNLKSRLVFEIHDSAGVYIADGEMEIMQKLFYDCMIRGTDNNPKFSWITIDFKAELDVYTEGNFATKPKTVHITGDVYEENYITA